MGNQALVVSLSLLCALPAALSAQDAHDRLPGLTLKHPALAHLSTWQQHVVQPEGQPVDKRARGVFPVGDGHVFAYFGLGRRANTAQALSGPHYQTAEVNAPKGHWGEWSFDLVESGNPVALPTQSVWRARGANVVLTEDATGSTGDRLTLSTVNWAQGGSNTIWRWVEVRNGGKSARQIHLRAQWERGQPNADSTRLVATYAAKKFAAELLCTEPAKAAGDQLDVDLGAVGAGATKTLLFVLRTKAADEDFAINVPTAATAASSLTGCADSWHGRLAGSVVFACDNQKLTDLIEDWKILMLVQQSASSGAIAPMINYRGSWVRDNNGALLALLRYGLFDDARKLLEFTYQATLVTGRLNNHVPLDLDVSKASEIEKTIQWGDLQIPNTELPAWVILQHEWYYRATWDLDLIQRHWPFLSMCYQAMKPDARGTLPTHGDETYLHGAFFSLFPDRLPGETFLPADDAGRRARSFDSSVAYLMSINAMSELIEDIDKHDAGAAAKAQGWASRRKNAYDMHHLDVMQKVESAFWLQKEKRFAPFLSPITGAPHTAPYGPVSLRPQWIGFTYAVGEKNRENLASTVAALWKKGYRIGMTPTVGYSVGHLQGYLLYSAADLDDQARYECMDALIKLAGPAGEWGELYDPEGRPIASYNANWPNRLRPWESGVNIDAILFALNGIRYVTCPGWSKKDQRLKLRMPRGSRWLTMRGVRHDGHRFDILLDETYGTSLELDDAGAAKSKMRFRVRYDTINPDAAGFDYVDAAVNVGETLYVRYPTLDTPIEEQDAWPVDKESHVHAGDGPGTYTPPLPTIPADKKFLFVTARAGAPVPDEAYVLDIGLPLQAEQFAKLLRNESNGRPRFRKLIFDVGARAESRRTFRHKDFWTTPPVSSGLAKAEKLGMVIVTPQFCANWTVLGVLAAQGPAKMALGTVFDPETSHRFTGAANGTAWRKATTRGQLDLRRLGGATEAPGIVYCATEVDAKRGVEGILRCGSDGALKVWLNDKVVIERTGRRDLAPDKDEVLVRLQAGKNRLLIKTFGSHGVYARFTDPDGLPLRGVR